MLLGLAPFASAASESGNLPPANVAKPPATAPADSPLPARNSTARPVSFMPGLSRLSQEGQALLAEVAARVKSVPRITILLISNFERFGSSEYAVALAFQRLQKVEAYLLNSGVRAHQVRKVSRIGPRGRTGETSACSGECTETRARIELQVLQ